MYSVWSYRTVSKKSNRNKHVGAHQLALQNGPGDAEEWRKDVTEVRDRLANGQAPFVHQRLSSAESLLCLKTANQLDDLGLKESWFKLIPSRLGRDRSLDLAAKAFLQANRYAIQCPGATTEACVRDYAKAISSLHASMYKPKHRFSDDALLTCAILAHCERSMGFQSKTKDEPMRFTLAHLYGTQAILESRNPAHHPSETSLAVLSWQCTIFLEVPVAFGAPSPFEKFKWFEPQPAVDGFPSTQVARLAAIGRKLLIDLPRLIMYVRRWRTSDGSDSDEIACTTFEPTAALARNLLDLKDDAAENAVLHLVKVTKTTDILVKSPIPYSFIFRTAAAYEAAMYYWQARLLIIRICLRMSEFLGASDEDHHAKRTEGSRTARNLFMSWQAGLEHGVFGRIRLIYAVPSLWGAISDFDTLLKVSKSESRDWLLHRANDIFNAIFGQITSRDMDDVAEVYVGGKLTGTFVQMYREAWPVKHPPSCIP